MADSSNAECPVCYTVYEPTYRCQYKHDVCNVCLLRCLSCPLCRSDLATFKDSNDHHAFCIFHNMGNPLFSCNQRVLGDHICQKELLEWISLEAWLTLDYIINGLREDVGRDFTWSNRNRKTLNELREAQSNLPVIWNRFFPDPSFREMVRIEISTHKQ